MTDIDLDAIDPNAPTEEELDYLSGGNSLLKNAMRQSGRAVADKIATFRVRLEAERAQAAVHDEDLVPDDPYEGVHDTELDGVIDGIDILDAYNRWCGKMVPNDRGKREGIMISCPVPGHPDANPSAWINTDKQTWFCGGCQIGGDKHDIAAYAKGFAVPGYKTDGTFPELRRQMAYDYGYIVRRSATGEDIVEQIEVVEEADPEPEPDPNDDDTPPQPPPGGSEEPDNPEPEADTPTRLESVWALPAPDFDSFEQDEPEPVAADPDPEPEPLAPIIPLRPDLDAIHAEVAEAELGAAALPWEHLIPEDTFLWEYMVQNCKYDIPHEYHFWMGLQAISFANGFCMRVEDVPPINSNLFVVLVGPTGLGKSRATQPVRSLIREVMPWTGTESMPGKGVKILGGIESGQALIKGIRHEYEDPAPASGVPGLVEQPNVRGWTLPEEFAGYVKKAMRLGSDFKERAIEFYDVARTGEVSVNAIKYGGEIKVVGPYLQVTSTTQPEAIHTYLSSEDAVSGFLNRYVFVSGPSRAERPPRWTRAHAPDLTRASAGLKSLVEFCERHDGTDITYTPDGDAAWSALYERIEHLKGVTGPMAVRLDLILKKVMLLFAINEHRTSIGADLVLRMEPIMLHLLANYTSITGDLYWRPDDACQDAILEYVMKKNHQGQHPRKKEIVDSLKRPTLGRSRFDIGRALDLLEKLEILKPVKVKSARGPERLGYKINTAEEGEVVST